MDRLFKMETSSGESIIGGISEFYVSRRGITVKRFEHLSTRPTIRRFATRRIVSFTEMKHDGEI